MSSITIKGNFSSTISVRGEGDKEFASFTSSTTSINLDKTGYYYLVSKDGSTGSFNTGHLDYNNWTGSYKGYKSGFYAKNCHNQVTASGRGERIFQGCSFINIEEDQPATYTHTINYNLNEGSSGPSSSSSTDYFESGSVTITKEIPKHDNKIFDYWCLNPSNDYGSYKKWYPGDTVGGIGESIILYAIWRNPEKYTITYDVNGGSPSIESQIKIEGKPIKLSYIVPSQPRTSFANAFFYITGYPNGGYFSNGEQYLKQQAKKIKYYDHPLNYWQKENIEIYYNPGDEYTKDEDLNLIGYYKSVYIPNLTEITNNTVAFTEVPIRDDVINTTYTVTFNQNWGSNNVTSQKANKKTSYKFLGWSTNSNATVADSNLTFNSETSVYAVWEPSAKTESIVLPTLSRVGYDFLGWSLENNDKIGITGTITPTSSQTYYAIWKANGAVKIYLKDKDKYVLAQPLIFTKDKNNVYNWLPAIPEVFSGGSWKISGG